MFNNAPDLKVAIRKYIDENAGLKKQVEEFMKEKGAALKARLVENAKEINGVKVVKAIIPMSADVVKDIAFQLKGEIPANLFVVIGSVDNNKPMLTVMISEDLVKAGQNAGKLVREAAKLIQGGGGGQPHFATAGGKNPDGLNAAVDKVIELAAFVIYSNFVHISYISNSAIWSESRWRSFLSGLLSLFFFMDKGNKKEDFYLPSLWSYLHN